jgi:phosphoserine phosphatase
VWNSEGIYQGRLESDLSPLGEEQALVLAQRLASRPLAAVYTSPLRRAYRTAELVLTMQNSIAPATFLRREGELAEIDHGEWSGLSHEQVKATWPELSEQWRANPASVRMPGGESLLEVRQRALTFLAAARQEHADGNILVVTHGTVLRLLLAHFLDVGPDHIWSLDSENCALSIVDDYEVPLIMAINDTCHLERVRSSVSTQVR